MLLRCSTDPSDPPFLTYGCAVDHYEACALEEMGCIGGCDDDATQLKLFEFLACFEGGQAGQPMPGGDWPNATWIDQLAPCAKKSGLPHDSIVNCTEGSTTKGSDSALAKAFANITAEVKAVHAPSYPWVVVNAVPLGASAFETCLLYAVCKAYTGPSPPPACVGLKPPAGCA